jgi:hypothetical protein
MSEYPTDEDLDQIRNWDGADPHGLMRFVQDLWSYPRYFTNDHDTWACSTGGWSGNECLIGAMRQNTMFWCMYWYSSRRGGHYVFRIKEQT